MSIPHFRRSVSSKCCARRMNASLTSPTAYGVSVVPTPERSGLNRRTSNAISRWTAVHTVRNLHVDVHAFNTLTERSGFRTDPLDAMYAGFFHDPRAVASFHSLWHLMQRDDPAASLAIDGAFLTFLAHYLPAAGTTLSPDWTPGAEDARLRRCSTTSMPISASNF
jgi:hypothetical protein